MQAAQDQPRLPDDHVFWDLEALKLAVCWPDIYRMYTRPRALNANNGTNGLHALGFLHDTNQSRAFDRARIANFGMPLIVACLRLSDKVTEQGD